MNKSDLIVKLVETHPTLSRQDVELSVKTMLEAMGQGLARGDRIEIRGFGSWRLNYKPPRIGRNPKTGGRVEVPEKWTPHFKAGLELRERVDQMKAGS